MVTCPLCGKSFRDKRGLYGHARFVHKYELYHNKPAKKTAMTEAIEQIVNRYRRVREEEGDIVAVEEKGLLPRLRKRFRLVKVKGGEVSSISGVSKGVVFRNV